MIDSWEIRIAQRKHLQDKKSKSCCSFRGIISGRGSLAAFHGKAHTGSHYIKKAPSYQAGKPANSTLKKIQNVFILAEREQRAFFPSVPLNLPHWSKTMVMRSDKVRALLPQLSDSMLFWPASNIGEAGELSSLSVVFKSVGQVTKKQTGTWQ